MRPYRKLIAFTLLCALCFAALAGCGGGEGAPAPTASASGEAPPEVARAEGPFALGDVVWNEEYARWTVAYGGFPVMDGSALLSPFAEGFASAQLGVEGLTDFSYKSIAMEQFVSAQPISFLTYDEERDICLESAPLNLLLLADYNGADATLLEHSGAAVSIEFARSALVLITHADNPVGALSKKEAGDVLAGRITDWGELGGNAGPIKLHYTFGLMENEAQSVLDARLLQGAPLAQNILEEQQIPGGVPGSDPYTVTYHAEYENAPESLGIVFYHEALGMEDVRLIAIDDVAPDRDSIRSGAYPLSFGCQAVYRQADGEGAPGNFARWCLTEEGQALVERTGLVAVK